MEEKNVKTNNIRHKKNGGITLIALVITIIVMLILVAVTVSIAVNGGLFNYAKNAGRETRFAILEEQLYSAYMEDIMADYANGTDNASFANAIAKLNLNGEYVIEPITSSGVANIVLNPDITTTAIVIGTDDETKTATFTATPEDEDETTNYYVVEDGKYYKINYNGNGLVKIDKDPSDVNTNNNTLSIIVTDETIATGSITGNLVTITGAKKAGNTTFKVKCGSVEKTGTINAVEFKTITFNANGGAFSSNDETLEVTGIVGSTQNMPAEPSRNKYAFTGWYEATDGDDIVYTGEENTVTIPETSTEVYAHWQMDLTNASLSVGDQVYITGVPSEKFYVIEASDSTTSTVKLLAKYNVKTTVTPYTQNSSANRIGFNPRATYSGSNVEALVKDYVSGNGTEGGSSNCKLNLTLGTGEEARLLLKSEIDALAGGDTLQSANYSRLPSWVKDTNYWLDTWRYNTSYYFVNTTAGSLSSADRTRDDYAGVRPVLILSKSRLSLVSE